MTELEEKLLTACKAQRTAMDILFTMLLKLDKNFLPSKSGQPWEAVVLGSETIKLAEKRKRVDRVIGANNEE
ncbi:hypothetical protein ES705_25348 [subsurface metagenome]